MQAFRAWYLVRTQVATGPLGGIIGLRYEGAKARLSTEGLDHPEVWEGLQVIEDVFVQHMRERTK